MIVTPAKFVDSRLIDSELSTYLEHVKDYFDFTEEDARLVRQTGDALRNNITSLMDEFYEKQLSYSNTASFFQNPDGTHKPEFDRARAGISNFLLGLADGRIDITFAQNAERIGDVHTKLKLEIRYMVGATSFFQQRISTYVNEYLKNAEADYRMKTVSAWVKLLDLTLDIMLRNYVKLTYSDLIVQLNEKIKAVENSKRQAELLQDILTHDVRNYNQIVKLSAELLKGDPTHESSSSLLGAILKAADGSSELVNRAKKLGRIMSQENPPLYLVSLEETLQRSIEVVVKANAEKVIAPSLLVSRRAKVLADDFLEEAFTNIISNAINYTAHEPVEINVNVDDVEEEGRPYWSIAFADFGRGIPDEMKERVFMRYLSTASGTGLGMSIIHALIVDRYHGKIFVTNRVEGDYSKGTVVQLLLPTV